MDLIVNDLSLHGQFADSHAFRDSIARVMLIRQIAEKHLSVLYCHRNFVNRLVTSQESVYEAVKSFSREEKLAVMAWLCRHGPFWDDDRQHNGEDWYECAGNIVTDSAVGEAAHYIRHGVDRRLVSLKPSDFVCNPVSVELVFEDDNRDTVDVLNYSEPEDVDALFAAAPKALRCWAALEALSVSRFRHLTFAEGAFEALQRQPFKQGVAERMLVLLDVLHRLKLSFNLSGRRTEIGDALYNKHFTGDKAWFSDESHTNKVKFRNELTFPNPGIPGENLFCPMHGKVKSPQYRLHFSWPITADCPTYVVYAGPKITKR